MNQDLVKVGAFGVALVGTFLLYDLLKERRQTFSYKGRTTRTPAMAFGFTA